MSLYSPQNARRSLIQTAGYRILSQAATIAGFVVLVRVLDEQSFGVLSLLYALVPIFQTVGSLGLDQTLRRFEPEYLKSGRPELARRLVRFVATVRFALSLLLLGLLLLGWNLFAPLFDLQAYRADFVVFGAVIVLFVQSLILQASLASRMQHQHSVGPIAVQSAAKLIGYALLPLLAEPVGLRHVIWVDVVATVLSYALLVLAHRRHAGAVGAADATFDAEERGRLRAYSTYSYLNDATSVLCYGETNRFFVGALLNAVAVAAYSFYGRLSHMLSQFTPVVYFENVVTPVLFAVRREEAAQRLPRYFTLLIDLNLLVHIPMIAFALVYHEQMVRLLFGGKYLEDSWMLPLVLAMGTGSIVLAIPITLTAQYFERARLILVSELFGLYQIAAMFALIPALGIAGAAIANGTFHLFRNLWVWYRLRDQVQWQNWKGVLGSAAAIWGAAATASALLQHTLGQADAANLAIGVVVFSVAMLLYLRSPGLSRADRDTLQNLMHGREARILKLLGLHAPT